MSDKDVLSALLERASRSSGSNEGDKPMSDDVAYFRSVALRGFFEAYLKQYTFEVGGLVRWKPGMRNMHAPRYGEPVLVMEIRTEPFYAEEQELSSPYFREPFNMRVLCLRDDGDSLMFWTNSARFEPFHEQAAKTAVVIQ